MTGAMVSSLYREQQACRKTNEECNGDWPQAQPLHRLPLSGDT